MSKHAVDPALIFTSKNFCLFSPLKARTTKPYWLPSRDNFYTHFKHPTHHAFHLKYFQWYLWSHKKFILKCHCCWAFSFPHLIRACCRCCWCFLTLNRQKIHFYWFVKSSVNNWYDFLRWKRKFRCDNRTGEYQGLVIDNSLKVLSLIKALLFYGMKIFSFLHLVNCKSTFLSTRKNDIKGRISNENICASIWRVF